MIRKPLEIKPYKTPRPYVVGSPIDDDPKTRACVLYLMLDFFDARNINPYIFFKEVDEALDKEMCQQIIKDVAGEKINVPRVWTESTVAALCADLCDIHKQRIANEIQKYENERIQFARKRYTKSYLREVEL